jgi:hypothetical protein
MLTALLVTSCFVMGVLFLVIASFLLDQGFRRAARANLVAALCCVVSGVVLPVSARCVSAEGEQVHEHALRCMLMHRDDDRGGGGQRLRRR